jgi:outer membrane protein W
MVLVGLVLTSMAAPAFAQRAEVGVTVGWVFSDGVSGSTITVPNQGVFDRVDPKDGVAWGLDIGVMVGPNAEVGFIYGQQSSVLQAGGSTTKDIGDMSVHTYHGYVGYNFKDPESKARPYLQFGLGATSFGDVNYTRDNGASGTISGLSRFSTTLGAGVKFYGSSKIGGRVGMRWTPAYIKSDAAGWWCDPYWGCYLVGNAQYANQFELNGGITFRF